MTYNLTNLTSNANTWYDIVVEVNQLSNGILFTFAMILLMIIYYVVFKKQNFKDVFLAGNFFSAIVSTLLFTMKVVSSDFLIVPYIMFFGAVLLFIFNNE